MYPVVSPSGVGGVQETRIAVGFSWTAMRSVGTEAAVMRIMHRVGVSLCIHMGANSIELQDISFYSCYDIYTPIVFQGLLVILTKDILHKFTKENVEL